MIWFFARGAQRLHYEIRHQVDGPGYEMVTTYPGGRQRIDPLDDPMELVDRSVRLLLELRDEGWVPMDDGESATRPVTAKDRSERSGR